MSQCLSQFELFLPLLPLLRCAMGPGAAANLNLLPNPNLVLLAHAIVQGAFSTDFRLGTSWWIWVQLVGFLITICLVLHNFHLDGMKCRCLTLALMILQLSASCGFCVVLLGCLCAWMFPLFPAGPPVPSKDRGSWKQCGKQWQSIRS